MGLFAEGAALLKKELISDAALPKPIPVFPSLVSLPQTLMARLPQKGCQGAEMNSRAEEESCLLRLCFRLGSAALCWYITPAELECGVKPRTQLSFS